MQLKFDGSTSVLASTIYQTSVMKNTPLAQNVLVSTCINKNILIIKSISEKNIFYSIRKLKPSILSGPDQIPTLVIKDCANVFVKPLSIIFNLILTSCVFPRDWKISMVCPVFKKGEKSDISNYRPVAILCNFA